MLFRHVPNNKSTQYTILLITIIVEFVRKYIILLTLNLKLTKPHTEVRRKKPPCFAYNVYPSATHLMVKHFSLIYTCLFSSSGAPSPSSLSLRLLLLLVPRWSWILGKPIQDSKTVLITRGGRGNSLIPCVPESSKMSVLNMSSSTVAAHCLHLYIFLAFRRPSIQLSDTIRCRKLRIRCTYMYLTLSWSELFRKQAILYSIWPNAIKILNTTCLVSTHGGFCIPWLRLLRALVTPLRSTQSVSIFINDARFLVGCKVKAKSQQFKRKQNNFGFINRSDKATLAIKKKGQRFER